MDATLKASQVWMLSCGRREQSTRSEAASHSKKLQIPLVVIIFGKLIGFLNPYPAPGPSRRSRPSRRSTPGPAEAAPRGPWYRFLAPRDGLSVFYSGQPKKVTDEGCRSRSLAAACNALHRASMPLSADKPCRQLLRSDRAFGLTIPRWCRRGVASSSRRFQGLHRQI